MIPILYLSHCGSSIGGGEQQLAYLVRNIDTEDYQPLVVCPDDGVFVEHLRAVDIPTVILELPPWRRTKSLISRYGAAKKLVDLAKKHNTQLIHTSDSWFNPYLCHVKKQLKIPTVSHVRTLLTSAQVRKYRFDRIDSIIAISQQSSTALIQTGIDAQKINVILNCVDVSAFQPACVTTTSEKYVVGIVGRIEPFKRQKLFVEIAAKVAAQHKQAEFHIIGGALNIPEHRTYEREVHQLVAEHQLHERILFTGHRSDIPQAMRELDLLVTLSAGSVIAEAMAAGTPVIGTPVGSTDDMIVHGVTGYILPSEPVETIADQIVDLAQNPKQSVRIGERARKHAEATFGVETHVQKVQGIYKKLLKG